MTEVGGISERPVGKRLANGHGANMSAEYKQGHGGHMQDILSEFRGLYESRMRRVDEAEAQGEDTTKVNNVWFMN